MPLSYRVDLGSHKLNISEWQPERRGESTTLLLLHATGFHGRVWDEVVSLLPHQHIIAWDMRGHGRSDSCESYNWLEIRADFIALIKQLELELPVVVGHSIGGWCAAATAAIQPDVLGNILLIDPVIVVPGLYESQMSHADMTVKSHPVSKRRNSWNSWEEMRDHFKDRKPFASWTDASLESYCRHGLIDNPDAEGMMLACHPEVEASIYVNSQRGTVEDDLGRIESYVRVMRAAPKTLDQNLTDFTGSPTWPELAAHLPRADDVFLPHLSHFMLMEDPKLIATNISSLFNLTD